MNLENGVRVRWAARVPPALVLRLYTSDATGIFDDELADDVGYALLDRWRSILRATDAFVHGRVECPGCARTIPHNWDKAAMLQCDRCSWQMTWGAYRNTIQGQRLLGGGAVDAFRSFVEGWGRARAYRDKLLAIDSLLHAFHHDLKQNPSSIAARNVIEGNTGEVLAFLDRLAYGDAGTPELRNVREAYLETLERSVSKGNLSDNWRRTR